MWIDPELRPRRGYEDVPSFKTALTILIGTIFMVVIVMFGVTLVRHVLGI